MIKSKGMEEAGSITRRKEEELHTSLYLIGESEESNCKRSVGELDKTETGVQGIVCASY
jgi:hypothetical protein